MGRDGSGNRVIDGMGLARFAKERALAGVHGVPGHAPPTSVRNAFTGIVTALALDDVVARVEVQAGPHQVVSLVTPEAVEELDLAVGVTVTARVKSTSVQVAGKATLRASRTLTDLRTEVHFMETADAIGPLGAKSMSESPFNPVAPHLRQRPTGRDRHPLHRAPPDPRPRLARPAQSRVTDRPRVRSAS